jgi:anti-anti-sigma factor
MHDFGKRLVHGGEMTGFRLLPGSDGVFHLEGELDALSADELDASVVAGLNGQADVVLDVSNLTFVDSSGIRAFIRLAKQASPRATVLRHPRPHVVRVLEIVRIEDFGIRLDTQPVQ